jgi:thiamine-phosphate diphosphorylase
VRKLAGFTLAVGVSTANLEQAKRAKADGADSVGLGPMFVSGTKPKPELAGLGYLRAFLADAEVGSMPHLAISGITPENVGELWAAGCRGVAVSSVVCGARDPRSVCEKLLAGAPAERTA